MVKRFRRRLRPVVNRWSTFDHWRSQFVFWAGGLLVGAAAVLVAVVADYAQRLFSGWHAQLFWLPLVLTPAGFVLSAFAAQRWFNGSQGSGIPQVIAAGELVHRRPGAAARLVSLPVIAGKSLLLCLGLMCGASIGREGPTVQIGAGLMFAAGRLGRAGNESALLLAGGAAGVAAAFNTPLAGIVFAIEELGRSFEHRTSGTVIFAVMLAGLASLTLFGDYTYFGRSEASLSGWHDIAAAAACGIAGGLMGGLFSRVLAFTARCAGARSGNLICRHRLVFAGVCGLLLGILGTASGTNVFGTGYAEAKSLLTGADVIPHGFGMLKMAGTLLSSVSGIPGGLFAPSLAAGAGIGADLHALVPLAPLATMALLGMAGYFSGVVQSPLTAFVIVLEMTNDHNMIVPLMASSLLGYSVSRVVCGRPLYRNLALNFRKPN